VQRSLGRIDFPIRVVDFRSDDDHKIEHILAEFQAEISKVGLRPVGMQTMWGRNLGRLPTGR